ncbi:MAG: type II toxin-antitoxin system death-on-curing family toxin [Chloroflexi bacterium]|nr:type II toxin-antitoxin system death-on-curing family toxin [Chloroflexota bacterium]
MRVGFGLRPRRPRWRAAADAPFRHVLLIDEFGGTVGIRAEGALAAAVMWPQLGYYATLTEEAAALMESLAVNHPFVDGNRREAFFVTDVFLRANGHFLDCYDREAPESFMPLFDANAFRFAELLSWLEDRVKPLQHSWTEGR